MLEDLRLEDRRLVRALRCDERRVVHRLLELAEQLGVAQLLGDVDRPGHRADELDWEGDSVSWEIGVEREEAGRTAGEGDAVALVARAKGHLEDGDEVFRKHADLVKDARDSPVVILLVHAPEALQVL